MADERWTLQTSPAEYLERYPEGPNADLARAVLDEGEEEADPILQTEEPLAGLRAEWEEADAEIDAALREANADKSEDRPLWTYRALTSRSVGRDIVRLERRLARPNPPLEKIEEAAGVLSEATAKLTGLDRGEELYEADEHDVVTEVA